MMGLAVGIFFPTLRETDEDQIPALDEPLAHCAKLPGMTEGSIRTNNYCK